MAEVRPPPVSDVVDDDPFHIHSTHSRRGSSATTENRVLEIRERARAARDFAFGKFNSSQRCHTRTAHISYDSHRPHGITFCFSASPFPPKFDVSERERTPSRTFTSDARLPCNRHLCTVCGFYSTLSFQSVFIPSTGAAVCRHRFFSLGLFVVCCCRLSPPLCPRLRPDTWMFWWFGSQWQLFVDCACASRT